MKRLFLILTIVSVVIWGCDKTIIKPSATKSGVILAYPTSGAPFNSLSGGINFFDKALISTSVLTADTTTFNFSADIPDMATSSITVTVGVDTSQLSYYNSHPELQSDTTHQTLALLPDSCYNIPSTTSTITAGSSQGVFQIQFYRKKINTSQTGYLLPVSITDASGDAINQNMKTIYFHMYKK